MSTKIVFENIKKGYEFLVNSNYLLKKNYILKLIYFFNLKT